MLSNKSSECLRESLLQLLKRCTAARDLAQGRLLHSQIASIGLEQDKYLANLLLQMYGKCGSVCDAEELFFRKIHSKNRFSWSIMISIYAQQQQLDDARHIFDAMPDGIRDVVHWNTILTGYANSGFLSMAVARALFDRMPQWSVVSWTALITVYAQGGHLASSRHAFDSMPERNVVSWTAILAAYTQHGHLEQARGLFSRMPLVDLVAWNSLLAGYSQDGNIAAMLDLLSSMPEKDSFTWSSLLAGYARAGNLEKAKEIFAKVPDVTSWTAMITAHAQASEINAAKNYFDKMPQRTNVSWNAMLAAFAEVGDLENAKGIFHKMPDLSIVSWNTILSGFAVQGCLEECKDIFDKMPGNNLVSWNAVLTAFSCKGYLEETRQYFSALPERNFISWNILLGAFAENGHAFQALNLLSAMIMEGFMPDALTFMSVLGACIHIGVLILARDHFVSMTYDHSIVAERDHYGCIVDLLSRAGKLDEAEELIKAMPFLPDATEWGILLGACKIYRDVDRVDRLAKFLLESKADRHGPYVLVSTTIRSSIAPISRAKNLNSNLAKDSRFLL
ncbi:pentatricopeptide repeat-containing protein At1g62260, mitochondrial-like [Selaginella moellendorffii]|uniref:pentatricopeptide repeat-containing protein At1g62260, mitochondrial-like n=1 Tax=Selaginella moellendorffii TaxID=88036 RepID=UPI000D1CA536|nr:pentatricopeptide repeat-containing protein At1g62260, mitochondrial-like [Selaginella moellendorffii]|eukprot:XP_024532391.1 pentatricopeptide repeat-containing protein At1g62260, mitochondrial-like [Selaginella moellendorffii]